MLVSKVFHQSDHRKAMLLVKRCECRPAIFDLSTSQQGRLYIRKKRKVGKETKSFDHRAGMAKLEIIKLPISLPPVAYLAIFSSSRSLGSNSRLRSYISCTSPAACRLLRRKSCSSGTGCRRYGMCWYCWMSRMTSAVLARLLKLISSDGVKEGIPSSMKVKSVK